MDTGTTPTKRGNDDAEETGAASMVSPRKIPKYDFWGDLRKKESSALQIKDLKLGYFPNATLVFRVIAKGRKFETANGKSFPFYAMDQTGKIKIFCFSKDADRLFDEIKYGQVYTLKGFRITSSNPQYMNLSGNSLQLDFIGDSQIQPSVEEMPELEINYISLDQLDDKINQLIDIVVIVALINDAETIIRSKDKAKVMRQEVQVTDGTEKIVSIYFWGASTKDLKFKKFDVIEFRNIHVKQFNNEVSMTFGEGSMVIADSETMEARALKDLLEKERNG